MNQTETVFPNQNFWYSGVQRWSKLSLQTFAQTYFVTQQTGLENIDCFRFKLCSEEYIITPHNSAFGSMNSLFMLCHANYSLEGQCLTANDVVLISRNCRQKKCVCTRFEHFGACHIYEYIYQYIIYCFLELVSMFHSRTKIWVIAIQVIYDMNFNIKCTLYNFKPKLRRKLRTNNQGYEQTYGNCQMAMWNRRDRLKKTIRFTALDISHRNF
ncbi:Hypothetical_protein [Hexamita inflata]|uniref:Hypothetical_protein n=1 Tax=Hexamita inflata TaxID=28002 RepID=A0ABP1H4V3_9EUKA